MTDDPLDGLPSDLVRVLRDPSIVIPQDQGVFELIARMTHAPSTAASAMTNEQWMQAWVAEWQRANRAEVELEELRAEIETEIRQRLDAVIVSHGVGEMSELLAQLLAVVTGGVSVGR